MPQLGTVRRVVLDQFLPKYCLVRLMVRVKYAVELVSDLFTLIQNKPIKSSATKTIFFLMLTKTSLCVGFSRHC